MTSSLGYLGEMGGFVFPCELWRSALQWGGELSGLMGKTMADKVTLSVLRNKAAAGERFAVLALYDAMLATLAEQAGIEAIIVGDSVMNTLYGQSNTLLADMEIMIRHTAAVRRGGPGLFVIADMPYMSYQPSVELAIRNAGRFMAEGGADVVKFEGGTGVLEQVSAVVKARIPVVGHLGYLPQSDAFSGGSKVQGRQASQAMELVDEAQRLADAGVAMLVLECVPANVTEEITRRLTIPTIGIGSGPSCTSQVLLASDMLGLSTRPGPKFAEKFADLAGIVGNAFTRYGLAVRQNAYPAESHCYHMKDDQRAEFERMVREREK